MFMQDVVETIHPGQMQDPATRRLEQQQYVDALGHLVHPAQNFI